MATTVTPDPAVPIEVPTPSVSPVGGVLNVGIFALVGFAAVLMIVLLLIVAFMVMTAVAPTAFN